VLPVPPSGLPVDLPHGIRAAGGRRATPSGAARSMPGSSSLRTTRSRAALRGAPDGITRPPPGEARSPREHRATRRRQRRQEQRTRLRIKASRSRVRRRRADPSWRHGGRSSGRRLQRRGGTGHGDATSATRALSGDTPDTVRGLAVTRQRLQSRGKLRRVLRRGEGDGNGRETGCARTWKRDGPHGRQQGATNLHGPRWRNPLKS